MLLGLISDTHDNMPLIRKAVDYFNVHKVSDNEIRVIANVMFNNGSENVLMFSTSHVTEGGSYWWQQEYWQIATQNPYICSLNGSVMLTTINHKNSELAQWLSQTFPSNFKINMHMIFKLIDIDHAD